MPFKILHAADLHLDSPLRGLESDPDAPAAIIRGATRQALTNLVDLAIAEDVALVLLAGDLYDGDWQDYRTGLFMAAALQRLTAHGIRVVAVSGNHDAASVITGRFAWPERATMLRSDRPDTVALPDLNLHIHGRSYARRDVREDLSAGYPAPIQGALNIGLLHTAANLGGGEHEPYAPCSIETLRNFGYQYWALGHIHTRAVLSENPWIVFPGNIQGRHVRETGPKGATLLTCEGNRVLAIEHRDLDAVRWAAPVLDLTGAADQEDVMARIRAALADASDAASNRLLAVRLTLTGKTDAHGALLRAGPDLAGRIRTETAAAGTGSIWLESVRIETTAPVPRAPTTEAETLLRQRLQAEPADAVLQSVADFASTLLKKNPALARALTEDASTLDPATIARARALAAAVLDGEV